MKLKTEHDFANIKNVDINTGGNKRKNLRNRLWGCGFGRTWRPPRCSCRTCSFWSASCLPDAMTADRKRTSETCNLLETPGLATSRPRIRFGTSLTILKVWSKLKKIQIIFFQVCSRFQGRGKLFHQMLFRTFSNLLEFFIRFKIILKGFVKLWNWSTSTRCVWSTTCPWPFSTSPTCLTTKTWTRGTSTSPNTI